jgi:predicted metal-dependent peptidase
MIELLKNKPFYAHFIAAFRVHIREDIPTMGVNITTGINLYINPKFWEIMKPKQQVALLEHEVLHILNNHIMRGEKLQHEIFNVACDLAINEYISDLPEAALFPEKMGLKRFQTAEFYYKDMIDKGRVVKIQIMGVPGNGKGQSQGNQPGKTPGTGGGEKKKGPGKFIDDHGLWAQGNQDPEYVKEKIRSEVMKSVDKCKEGGIGSVPAQVRELIKQLTKPQVDWKLVLRRFLAKASLALIASSRKRRNKRFGIIYPGSKTYPKLDLVTAIDTSGSISNDQLDMFFGELRGINNANCRITVIECDAAIGKEYEYTAKTVIQDVTGRGGTSFSPVFKRCEKIKPDCLIYLTDGMNYDHGEVRKPNFPVLWALTRQHDLKYKWGSKIVLKE